MTHAKMINSKNPTLNLKDILPDQNLENCWVKKNTAILISHGIGNQLPLETIDQFGRGLVEEYSKMPNIGSLQLTHLLVSKPDDSEAGIWFDNIVRITMKNQPYHIDLYEYYWANYTQDKVDLKDIIKWINGVSRGAEKFYDKTATLGLAYERGGPFFNKKGKFIHWKYNLFLKSITYLIPIVSFIFKLILNLISFIPVIGSYIKGFFSQFLHGLDNNLSNVIGDIVIYNVTDPKTRYYCVKRQILDGAVDALKYLIQKTEESLVDSKLAYPSIVVVGHSLGTQVSYDAINKLNLLVNKGKISTYNSDGSCKIQKDLMIHQQLNNFITFGSPLDKIAFFLRELVPENMYLRQQLLDDYHGFKQKSWNVLPPNAMIFYPLTNTITRLLEDVNWRNYYDDHDYVSGALDFYEKLTNVNCNFKCKWYGFTHSSYWDCGDFYKDIILNSLM